MNNRGPIIQLPPPVKMREKCVIGSCNILRLWTHESVRHQNTGHENKETVWIIILQVFFLRGGPLLVLSLSNSWPMDSDFSIWMAMHGVDV